MGGCGGNVNIKSTLGIDIHMPVALNTPPPLVTQDGSSRFSEPCATLTSSSGLTTEVLTEGVVIGSQRGTLRSCFSAPSNTLSSPTATPKGSLLSGRCSPPETSGGRVRSVVGSAAPSSTAPSRSASGASSSTTSKLRLDSSKRRRCVSSRTRGLSMSPGASTRESKHSSPPMVSTTTHRGSASEFPSFTADAALSSLVPLPVLVEQQRDRIFSLVQERDSVTAELSALRVLFQRLRDDYDETKREADGLTLQLSSLRGQYEAQGAEMQQFRVRHAHQQKRIDQFEGEWANSSKHLREQLDTLAAERDALQAQRDACMVDSNDLRQQLIRLQWEMHRAESKHREALRAQEDAHAQQLRSALQEKEEQLQGRAAATRREARLVQQELDQLGVGHSVAHEERESMRWKVSELEAVVAKKEQLRGELERMVSMLRSRLTDQEEAVRQDAQRYAQRAQDLEHLYRGQVAQEQHRAQMLQDDLAAARKSAQEALRQQEALQQSHREQVADLTSRASKLEDDLRLQLRSARAELEDAQARALQHEAAARRSVRDAEALQAKLSTEQEVRERLQQAHTAQARQLSRAESSLHVLQARLQESERGAELLRCVMEQATWTREMKQAAQHTLASLLGVPRVSLQGGQTQRNGKVAAGADGEEREEEVGRDECWSPALQLEWAAGTQGIASSLATGKGQQTLEIGSTDGGDIVYTTRDGSGTLPPRGVVTGSASSPSSPRGAAPVRRAEQDSSCTVSSPQRLPAVSTHEAACQHVETIQRSARRGADQNGSGKPLRSPHELGHVLQPPLSFRAGSPLRAPPPLHPGTPRTTAAGSPYPGQRSAGCTATSFGGDRTAVSPFSSAVRGLSFAPAEHITRAGEAFATGRGDIRRSVSGVASMAQHFSLPSSSQQKVRHIYNISKEEEGEEEEEEEGGHHHLQHQAPTAIAGGTAVTGSCAAGLTHGSLLTGGLHLTTPLRGQSEEIFFDDMSASRRRRVPVTMLGTCTDAGGGCGAAVGASDSPQTASAPPATASSEGPGGLGEIRVTPSRSRGVFDFTPTVGAVDGGQPAFVLGGSVSHDRRVLAPGVRAAELIAQLSHPSSVSSFVGTAGAAAPVSSSAGAALHGGPDAGVHHNILHSGNAALQQYLRDTVQHVLENEARERRPQRLQSQTPPQLPGSYSACSAISRYTADHPTCAGEVVEEDFGSASRPHSSVAVPLLLSTRQPASTVNVTSGDRAIRTVDPGEGPWGSASLHDSAKTPHGLDGSAVATRSRRSIAAVFSPERCILTRRGQSSIADTLGQLAGRQQRLLRSLGLCPQASMSSAVSSADVASSSPRHASQGDSYPDVALHSSAGVTAPNSVSPQEECSGYKPHVQHEPEDSHVVGRSSMGVSPVGTGMADTGDSLSMISTSLPRIGPDHLMSHPISHGKHAYSSGYTRTSDVVTDVELDPRQLSYSATVSTTQVSVLKEEDQTLTTKRMADRSKTVGTVLQDSQHGKGQGSCPPGPASATGVAATLAASVRSALSVSEVSSLSQLERRFATPF